MQMSMKSTNGCIILLTLLMSILCYFCGWNNTDFISRLENHLDEIHHMVKHQKVKREIKEGFVFKDHLHGGATFVRWGRNSCDTSDLTFMVYRGFAASSHHAHTGGGSNVLCLDREVTYTNGRYVDNNQGSSYIYGVEYSEGAWADSLFDLSLADRGSYKYYNVPCVVCMTKGTHSQLIIPGQDTCPKSWKQEYSGYILSSSHNHKHSMDYICVDDTPHIIPDSQGDQGGGHLHIVEAQCPSLQCGPYVAGREIRCVVCTK